MVGEALFKRTEEEKGFWWLGIGAEAGHSDSWNTRLRHYTSSAP